MYMYMYGYEHDMVWDFPRVAKVSKMLHTMLVLWQAGTWKTVLCNRFEKGTCTRGSLAIRYCTLEGLVVRHCKFYLKRCEYDVMEVAIAPLHTAKRSLENLGQQEKSNV